MDSYIALTLFGCFFVLVFMFLDTSVDEYFKIGSTIKTDREIDLDGVTYAYVTIDVSSKS
ncbi:hypothetical protein NE680_25775, partial [Escherichia coli]|nr:hypothetical protein [Escherichia coli]